MTSAWVFIDYQNVHLSAWQQFTPYGTEVYHATIHPMHFAKQVSKKRSDTLGRLELDCVLVFRGMPNSRKQGTLASIVARQHRTWGADPHVQIRTRPLRYLREWPDTPAEEKGVDVLLAVTLVKAVIENRAEKYIVATRDTDLLPAIELCESIRPGAIETVSWYGTSDLAAHGLPNHVLGEAAYRASRDPHDYGAELAHRRR